jgi:hypothetical protein
MIFGQSVAKPSPSPTTEQSGTQLPEIRQTILRTRDKVVNFTGQTVALMRERRADVKGAAIFRRAGGVYKSNSGKSQF